MHGFRIANKDNSAFMNQGSYAEALASSRGAEPVPSRSQPRGPHPRYVQQTLGKLKNDSSRTEQNVNRYLTPQGLPELSKMTPPGFFSSTVETPKTTTQDSSKPPVETVIATPVMSMAAESVSEPEPSVKSQRRQIPSPDSLMAETCQSGVSDATQKLNFPDCRSRTISSSMNGASTHRAVSRLEPLDASPGSSPTTGLSDLPASAPTSQASTRDSISVGSGCRSVMDAMHQHSSWPAWSQDVAGRPWIMADMLRWSAAFQEQMQHCVREVQSVVEDANIKKMVAEFSETMQAEKQEKFELRKHIEELLKVNVELRQTQLDWFATKGVDQIVNNCFAKTAATASLDIQNGMQESFGNLQATLDSAVEEITNNIAAQFRKHETKLKSETSRDRWRHAATTEKVARTLEGHMEALQKEIEHQQETGSTALQHEIQDIKSKLEVQVAESSQKRKTMHIATEEIEQLLSRQDVLIEDRLEKATAGFKDVQAHLTTECDEWQHRFVEAEVNLMEARTKDEVGKIEREKLEHVVHEMEVKMQQMSCRTGMDIINKIKEIERHGNISVNLKNGDVEMVRALEFVPRSSKQEPSAEFADQRVATGIIEDLVSIQKLFYVNMVVEGHTRGSDAHFFQMLADNRAHLIKDHIVSSGVSAKFISPKGFPGPKGLNRPCVVIRLDIFPDNN